MNNLGFGPNQISICRNVWNKIGTRLELKFHTYT